MLQLQIVNFRKGTYLVVEGKADTNQLNIIQKGSVQCIKATGSGIAPVLYGPGDFVGVVPCMSGHLQIETAVALKIIKTFANRMRVMNEMLTKATLNSVTKETYEQIFNVASFYEKTSRSDIAIYAYYQYLKTKPTGPNADIAKQKFIALKPKTHAVYFEPTEEMNRSYPKDTMIFSESQSGADMFIIQKGEVTISKVVNGNEVILCVLKKGDMFGEMALLENKPRSANAIAHSDCVVMVINRSNFNQMVSTQPQLISKLTTTLAERLWSMYRQLDNANLRDPLSKMIDMLSLQIEKQKISIGTTKQSMQTELTPKDLANMCALPNQYQAKAIYQLEQSSNIDIVGGKIFIKDLLELTKQAAFYRKQNNIS